MVRGLTARRLPICLLVRPSTSSAAISRSRGRQRHGELPVGREVFKAPDPACMRVARVECLAADVAPEEFSLDKRFITRSSA